MSVVEFGINYKFSCEPRIIPLAITRVEILVAAGLIVVDETSNTYWNLIKS